MKKIAYVGIDYHKSLLAVVVLPEGSEGPVDKVKLENNDKKIRKYLDKLSKRYEIQSCYEASGCGYVFYRQMQEWGYPCRVVAPSKIPKVPGDRVKTDFKDAENLAYQFRNGSLTFVHVPDPEQEAVRSLMRLRHSLKQDSKRVKIRISSLLNTQGLRFAGTSWTQKHQKWLNTLKLPGWTNKVLFEYRCHLEYLTHRLCDIDREIEDLSLSEPYAEPVKALISLRGIQTLTAMSLVCEIIDFQRFPNAKALMAYLGLTPSEYSSSGIRRTGSITKTGNSICRTLLIESAQHYRKKPNPTLVMRAKWKGQNPKTIQTAMRCMQRLHKRYWALALRKPSSVAVVAVARELAGFVWTLMQPQKTVLQTA